MSTEAADAGGRRLSLVGNSLALISSKVAGMGLGFLFWLAAARLYDRHDVGLAAAAVSGMMLCTQLALMGVGSSVISLWGEYRADRVPLVRSSLTLVGAVSAVAAVVFLLVAGVALHQLDVVVSSWVFGIAFIGAVVFGTLTTLQDQISTALRRGDHAVSRNVLFGATTLAGLLVLAALTSRGTAGLIFAPWVAGGFAAVALGGFQLRRALAAEALKPRFEPALARRLVRVGLPNHLLTLAERVPGLILPVVVLEVLSPQANAVWYSAWMMAWVVFIVPIQVGMTIFAEVAEDPSTLRHAVRRGLATSLAVGGAGVLVVLVAAHPLLSLLGPQYADAGEAPLRILVLGLFPLSVTIAYFATCRAVRRLREAIVLGWLVAAGSVAAAAIVARTGGLDAMAVAWVAVQVAGGTVAAVRLRAIAQTTAAERAPAAAGAPARRGVPGRASQAVAAVGAAALWLGSLSGVSPADIGDLGLATALPATAFVALTVIVVSFTAALCREHPSDAVLAITVIALIVMLYGATAVIEQVPSFNVTWRHAGIAGELLGSGQVDRSIDAYFNWPVFFALMGAASRLAGLGDPIDLSRWAPVAFNLLYLPPLIVLARAATPDRRLAWAAVWFFFLANWVYQDYLSPQGLVYLLYLVVLAAVLKWFPRPGTGPSGRTRADLVVVVALMVAAAVPSHQLTPFALLVSLLALAATRRTSLRMLPLYAAVLTVGWTVFAAGPYLSGHFDELTSALGDLGSALSANVGSRVAGSDGHLTVVRLRLALTALLWVAAIAGAVRMWRRGRWWWPTPVVLAAAPFVLVVLQPYGGEMLLRVFLFTLPFVALLAASVLPAATMRGAAVLTLAGVIVLGGFLFARYGNARVTLFRPGEVQVVDRLYATAPSRSVVFAPNTSLPWQGRRYADLRWRTLTRTLEAAPEGAAKAGGATLAARLADAMKADDAPASYLVVTRSSRNYDRMFGSAPWGTVAALERAVSASPSFRVVAGNADGRVYELRPSGGPA